MASFGGKNTNKTPLKTFTALLQRCSFFWLFVEDFVDLRLASMLNGFSQRFFNGRYVVSNRSLSLELAYVRFRLSRWRFYIIDRQVRRVSQSNVVFDSTAIHIGYLDDRVDFLRLDYSIV